MGGASRLLPSGSLRPEQPSAVDRLVRCGSRLRPDERGCSSSTPASVRSAWPRGPRERAGDERALRRIRTRPHAGSRRTPRSSRAHVRVVPGPAATALTTLRHLRRPHRRSAEERSGPRSPDRDRHDSAEATHYIACGLDSFLSDERTPKRPTSASPPSKPSTSSPTPITSKPSPSSTPD